VFQKSEGHPFSFRMRDVHCIRFGSPGPLVPEKDQAINYAQNRASFPSGEIRLLDSTGKLEHTIAFNEKNRKL